MTFLNPKFLPAEKGSAPKLKNRMAMCNTVLINKDVAKILKYVVLEWVPGSKVQFLVFRGGELREVG